MRILYLNYKSIAVLYQDLQTFIKFPFLLYFAGELLMNFNCTNIFVKSSKKYLPNSKNHTRQTVRVLYNLYSPERIYTSIGKQGKR